MELKSSNKEEFQPILNCIHQQYNKVLYDSEKKPGKVITWRIRESYTETWNRYHITKDA